jgi:hypothetical protein
MSDHAFNENSPVFRPHRISPGSSLRQCSEQGYAIAGKPIGSD